MNLRPWIEMLMLTLIACGPSPAVEQPVADLVLQGGTVHTMVDSALATEAVAITGGRVTAVGTAEDLASFIGDTTEVIELDGAVVIPGLIENHGHFLGMGEMLQQLDLTAASSWAQIVEMAGKAADAAGPDEWILGRGWHQEKWTAAPDDANEGFPVHGDLSRRVPGNPVVLTHASGHAVLINSRAMVLAGIDTATAAPEGGEVVLDADGHPTGLLLESAGRLAWEAWSQHNDRTLEALQGLVASAAEAAARNGITTFVDAGTKLDTLTAMAPMFADGNQPVRLWAMIRDRNETLSSGEIPPASSWFRVGGIKVSLDGALGSRGAWLLEPYADAPGETGFQLVTLESLRRTAEIALERDLQLGVHAIGDRANREVLGLYEEVFGGTHSADRRWRVEHAQNIHPDDIRRFAELGVVASMQGIHCTSDGPWVPLRLGDERSAQRAYRWRDLLDSGAVVVNGTDVPVEPIDPFASLAASISREMNNGRQFYPDQAMTPMEALVTYTRDGAWAIGQEADLGTIEPGKLADLTILDRDPLAVDAASLRDTRVLRTLLGGRTVFQAE